MSVIRSGSGGRRGLLIALPGLVFGCAAAATSSAPIEETAGAGIAGSRSGAASSGAPGVAGAISTAGGTPGIAGAASAGAGRGGTTGSAGSNAAGSVGVGGGKCSTSGPAGQAFFDGFEDGEYAGCPNWVDADPTLGGMWSVKADGATKVLSQNAAVSDWVIAVSGDYKVTDQTVQAKVKFGSEPGEIGIFARVQDLRNYYFLYLDGSNIVLRGRVDNSQLTSVKVKQPAVAGTWYTLKLSVIGSTLTGYLDGTMLVTTTDSGVKSGGIGVGTGDGASGEFDDVTVTVP